jgi:hypothetical protein
LIQLGPLNRQREGTKGASTLRPLRSDHRGGHAHIRGRIFNVAGVRQTHPMGLLGIILFITGIFVAYWSSTRLSSAL